MVALEKLFPCDQISPLFICNWELGSSICMTFTVPFNGHEEGVV
jgi:hypothetical protein